MLRFRRRRAGGFDRTQVEVEPRSAYLLSGEARHEWEHSIAPGETLRFSITFRTLSEKGRRIAASA
jgi:alkylated DNA repair dioxygenase AlkB